MGKLLYIKASPRGERSKSIRVAEAFVDAYKETHPEDAVETLDLFQVELPAFDGPALQAKYAILHGRDHTDEEARAWKAVEQVIEQFKSADKYVLAVPMWNFGIPYRLKHYMDLLIQPGYTFSFSPEEGYAGLVTGKPITVIYARGGDYSGAETAVMDFQKTYMGLVLGFIGFTDIRSVVVEPTLLGGPELAQERTEQAAGKARDIAVAI